MKSAGKNVMHTCISNSACMHAGYIELLIETDIFEVMYDVDIAEMSVCVKIAEKIGIVSFRDANFILRTEELQSSVGKLY